MDGKEMPEKKAFRSGFVAVVGRPNAGKSTLVNRLVGQKIAIVTSKPQTTRNRIQGIVTKPQGQIVFIDTPGLHEADSALGRQMMQEVAAALEGIDVLLLMVDASRMHPHADDLLLEKAKRFRGKTILALNKVDRLPKPKLLPLIDAFAKAFEFAAIVPISALKGHGCEELLEEILKQLPEGEPYFPEDQVTDQPERFLAESDSSDVPRSAIRAGSGGRKVRRDAQAIAHRSAYECGARFAEENPDWPQGRDAEEDRNGSSQRTRIDSWHQNLFGIVRESGAGLAGKSSESA
jgi:small GTP-binding protein